MKKNRTTIKCRHHHNRGDSVLPGHRPLNWQKTANFVVGRLQLRRTGRFRTAAPDLRIQPPQDYSSQELPLVRSHTTTAEIVVFCRDDMTS